MLEGLRVVSLAQQYPGPYCTMLLADLGADVVLVEQSGGGDPARGPDGMRPFFATINRNKRSITLDLKSDPGKEVLWRLLGSADALLEGFRPGVMERLGFGSDAVLTRYPRLAYVSISGYGQDGPDRFVPGHDLSYQGRSGLLADLPEGASPPHSLAIADLSSAMFAATGTLAALLAAARTGQGHYVDVSMTEGLVSWSNVVIEAALNDGGERLTASEPGYGVFACGDGNCITLSIAFEDHFWRALCGAFGWSNEVAELGAAERTGRRDELRERIAGELRLRPASDWLTRLVAAGVPCGPASTPDQVIDDPHFRARELFVKGPSESGGERWFVANPLKVNGGRPPIRLPAPRLGEHTEEILKEAGYSPAEIERLRSARAV